MNFFVEGSLRDLSNPNKPSTMPIGDAYLVGKLPGTDVHWGLAAGVLLAIVLHILLSRTTSASPSAWRAAIRAPHWRRGCRSAS